jgi:hypothetical protein
MVRAEWCSPPTRLGREEKSAEAPRTIRYTETVAGGCEVHRLMYRHPLLGDFLGIVITSEVSPAQSA